MSETRIEPADIVELGRKVFFLYPHSVMREQLMELIFQAGYEVYFLRDHVKAVRLLPDYPGSLLFVNIDERVKDTTWEKYVAALMQNPKTQSLRIGVLSYNSDQTLAQKFLMELAVPCGFVQLKLGLAESARILLSVLEANEARGKRKFVRVIMPRESAVSFSVKQDNNYLTGYIRDLSIAGMACSLLNGARLANGNELADLQLNLRGTIVRTSGKVVGSREVDDSTSYVVMFTSDTSETKHKLHLFIYTTLQSHLDRKIASL